MHLLSAAALVAYTVALATGETHLHSSPASSSVVHAALPASSSAPSTSATSLYFLWTPVTFDDQYRSKDDLARWVERIRSKWVYIDSIRRYQPTVQEQTLAQPCYFRAFMTGVAQEQLSYAKAVAAAVQHFRIQKQLSNFDLINDIRSENGQSPLDPAVRLAMGRERSALRLRIVLEDREMKAATALTRFEPTNDAYMLCEYGELRRDPSIKVKAKAGILLTRKDRLARDLADATQSAAEVSTYIEVTLPEQLANVKDTISEDAAYITLTEAPLHTFAPDLDELISHLLSSSEAQPTDASSSFVSTGWKRYLGYVGSKKVQ